MKTKFTFTVELGHTQLNERAEITFATNGEIAVSEGEAIVALHVEGFDVHIALEPETREPRATECGKLHITVSGPPEKLWPFAERVAAQTVELLAFYYDGMRLLGGMVFAERIPESEEERAAIGDNAHAARANFIEADPPRRFDREHLRSLPFSLDLGRVLRQFAVARASDNPIDAYLNMFKVVETLYHRGKLKARDALDRSDELKRLLRQSFETVVDGKPQEPTDRDVADMIVRLVEVRDNCAHLREHNAFGYAPGDPEVQRRVEPLYEILSDTARAAIQQLIETRRSKAEEARAAGA